MICKRFCTLSLCCAMISYFPLNRNFQFQFYSEFKCGSQILQKMVITGQTQLNMFKDIESKTLKYKGHQENDSERL